MVHQISNNGDYIVEVNDELYKNNFIHDIVELKLAIGKRETKQYQIMAMSRKNGKCYFRVKELESFFDKKSIVSEYEKVVMKQLKESKNIDCDIMDFHWEELYEKPYIKVEVI